MALVEVRELVKRYTPDGPNAVDRRRPVGSRCALRGCVPVWGHRSDALWQVPVAFGAAEHRMAVLWRAAFDKRREQS